MIPAGDPTPIYLKPTHRTSPADATQFTEENNSNGIKIGELTSN